MKQLFLILCAVGALSLTSCKKEADDPALKEVEQKLQGRWQIQNIIINDKFGGEDHIKSYPGTSSEYVEFTSDGKMRTVFRGTNEETTYSVLAVNKIAMGGDDASIKVLTASNLKLSSRDATGSVGFTEVIYDLVK